ncbi:MAG: hypothetical protein CVV23_16355 [Ignavibacteriae bacterium HGW-Ignavibacteriae-2]|nr:MAG: hypothetical protein CVV23_16355 [Ignavibacteriae bacterium HGW-Ignavibacteriae-2]
MSFLKSTVKLSILVLILNSCVGLNNLTDAKKQVKLYYESGEYEKEYTELAEKIINDFEAVNFGEMDAVVFDVDETVLSNYKYIKSLDFGYEHKLWTAYLQLAEAQSIKPAVKLIDWFNNNGVRIIFLTGRDHTTYKATKHNLILQGIAKFDTLICRGENDIKLSAEEFKNKERKLLEENGYNIIATIGDLQSDLHGEFTGRKYKMPNYMYDF